MTDRLREIEERTEKATPPHAGLAWGPMTTDDGNLMDADQVADWVQLALGQGGGPAYSIIVERSPAHGDGRQATVALTGNGPTSLANARFWVMARTDIPWLIAEIRRLLEAGKVRDKPVRSGFGGFFCPHCGAKLSEGEEHMSDCPTVTHPLEVP